MLATNVLIKILFKRLRRCNWCKVTKYVGVEHEIRHDIQPPGTKFWIFCQKTFVKIRFVALSAMMVEIASKFDIIISYNLYVYIIFVTCFSSFIRLSPRK